MARPLDPVERLAVFVDGGGAGAAGHRDDLLRTEGRVVVTQDKNLWLATLG